MAYYLAAGRRRTILDNVRRFVPNASRAERRAMARRTFANLMSASVDLFRLPSATREEILATVEVHGREHLDAALALGHGVICVTPHLGPYELGGAWFAAAGYAVNAMVEDIDPETNAALGLYRQATGMKLISRSTGLRATFRVLRGGEVVMLVADRVVGEGSEGIVLPFGEGTRPIPTGPATFALATGSPLIVGHIALKRGGSPRYVIRLEPPIIPERSGNDSSDQLRLTTRLTERMAAAVKAHPDQWYVFQPQWTPA
jgi:KDO2-lipid IV(A) lauroyltransferase